MKNVHQNVHHSENTSGQINQVAGRCARHL